MQNPAEDSLFDLKLTTQGVSALKRTSKMIKWLFLVSMLACLLLLGISLLEMSRFKGYAIEGKGLAGYYYRSLIHPVISLVDIGLIISQFLAYFRFGQVAAKAILEGDVSQFNNSFIYLARFTKLLVAQMCLIVLLYMLSFYYLLQFMAGASR
jgi:hypothetical protein